MLCTMLSILGSHEVGEVQCLENAIEEVRGVSDCTCTIYVTNVAHVVDSHVAHMCFYTMTSIFVLE
jgi:hypothetical protein